MGFSKADKLSTQGIGVLVVALFLLIGFLLFLSSTRSVGQSPKPQPTPAAGSVVTVFPKEIKYTRGEGCDSADGIFTSNEQEWRPLALCGENVPRYQCFEPRGFFVSLRVYDPDGAEVTGVTNEAPEQLPGDINVQGCAFSRVIAKWNRTGSGSLPEGQYRVVVEWSASHNKIDEWNFNFLTPERVDVYDGAKLLKSFDSLYEARKWAVAEVQKLKGDLVIKDAKTGQVIETVPYEPTMPGMQTAPQLQPGAVNIEDYQGQISLVGTNRLTTSVTGPQDFPVNNFLATAGGATAVISYAGIPTTVPSGQTRASYNFMNVEANTTLLYTNTPLYKQTDPSVTTVQYEYPVMSGEQVTWTTFRYYLPAYEDSILQQMLAKPGLVLIKGNIKVGELYVKAWVNPKVWQEIIERAKAQGSEIEALEGQMLIYTPLAVVRAEGTAYELTATEDGVTEAKVDEGRVTLTDLRNGQSVSIGPGEKSQVSLASLGPSAPEKTEGLTTLLASIPVWVWISLGSAAGIIVTLTIVIVILLVIRRKPKTA
mgnify:CR=1 FL=1